MALYESQVHEEEASDYHIWLSRENGDAYSDLSREIDPNGMYVRPWTYPDYQHPSVWTTDRAIEMLSLRDPTRPFLMHVNYQRPHTPMDPPADLWERYRERDLPDPPVGDWAGDFEYSRRNTAYSVSPRVQKEAARGYYAQLAHIDFQVGRIYNYLRKRGLLETTWIIFASDHGEMLGDHHQYKKMCPFEGSARIPFVIKPPRGVKPVFTERKEVVSHFDLFPTVAGIAGLPVPKGQEGMSLLPLLSEESFPWREFLHGEHASEYDGRPLGWQYLTDGRMKYIWESQSGKELLFDLIQDREELHDIATVKKSQCEKWRDRLCEVLSLRPQDGLVGKGGLLPGKVLPPVRKELLRG